ncbi:hypothetical protein AB0F88_11980 [Streptosporangium sp. NPDC023963]|uniref:hypothetical protein n=1 Tax=Streptosporangium sp. NPDC023963 TaxID=3155608 RepID=UPI003415280D
MTITESELREILNGDGDGDGDGGGDEGHNRGVTVAGVHRRVRAIRRRRRWTAGGVVVLGLVASLVSSPSARSAWMPEDVWTGVMARPEKTPQAVSGPVGGPVVHEKIASSRVNTEGGVREDLAFTMTSQQVRLVMRCEGTLYKAAFWVDGRLITAGPCGDGEGDIRFGLSGDFEGEPGSRHTLTGVVMKTGLTSPEGLTGSADVDRLLREQRPFPYTEGWGFLVFRLEDPECLDDVRQVDPRTGEMVRMECGDEGAAPSGHS